MDRTTVDALKALGKALCGDSFEVTPGLTDAEMIFEIAKQYQPPEGGGGDDGSGGGVIRELIIEKDDQDNDILTGITWEEFNAVDGLPGPFIIRLADDPEAPGNWYYMDCDGIWNVSGTGSIDEKDTVLIAAIYLGHCQPYYDNEEGYCYTEDIQTKGAILMYDEENDRIIVHRALGFQS